MGLSFLPVVMISQESTTKDVKLVGGFHCLHVTVGLLRRNVGKAYAAILHIMLAVDFTAGCYLRPVILQIFFVT